MWTEERIRERLWHYLAGEGFGPKWAQRIVQPDAQSKAQTSHEEQDARMVAAMVKLGLEIATPNNP